MRLQDLTPEKFEELKKDVKALNTPDVVATSGSQPVSVGSSAWLDALAENWEWTIRVLERIPEAERVGQKQGELDALRECLKQLRAGAGSASNVAR